MKKNILCFLITAIVFLVMIDGKKVYAANNAETVDGQIKFYTEDTGATTKTTWTTVGFTIRRNTTGGEPRQDSNYGEVWLKEEYKHSEDAGGGKVKITFTIPKVDVDKALRKAGLENIKENDTFYLNGIFQVKHKGVLQSKKYYTFKTISQAEGWGDSTDFWDRFDVKCVYHGGKEPVKIRYETTTGQVIEEFELPKNKWIPSGEEVAYKLDLEKTYKGKKYKLIESYFMRLADKKKKKLLIYKVDTSPLIVVQQRSEGQEVGGIQFVAVMGQDTTMLPPDEPEEEGMDSELTEPMIEAVIQADDRGSEKFEVLDGIPTSEDLYVNVMGTDYLTAYEFVKKAGNRDVPVRVSKTYQLNWTEISGDGENQTTKQHTETKTVTRAVNVQKPYSYWEILSLDYFTADYSVVENYALPGEKVTIPVSGYTFPELTFQHESDSSKHVFVPKAPDIHLGTEIIDGGSLKPSIPEEDFSDMVLNQVPDLQVQNDTVTFAGKVIMSGERVKKAGLKPEPIPESENMLPEDAMYMPGQTIDNTKLNGEFESSGVLHYTHAVKLNSRYAEPEYSTYEIPEINLVTVHTPVVCNAKVEDKKANNQMIQPDKRYAGLVLDLPFYFSLPTNGEHRDIHGYRERDYGKYTARREAKFSFDVYKGTQYIKAGTWTNIIREETQFHIPLWVNEGRHVIECRSIAINADANNMTGCEEDLANLDLENYVAVDMIQVEISGRIYDMNLFDISDYPIWESVFRKPGSLERSGIRYTVGNKNKNGEANGSNHTLTLVNGSHPYYQNIGVVKTGYVTRFAVTTVGNMYGQDDYIKIKPKFYYVKSDGSGREEVDLYYSETIHGKKYQLVKVGSDLDAANIKTYRLGDPYLAVPEQELRDTAAVKKLPLIDIKNTKKSVFTFSNIMIPESMRTFVGNETDVPGGIRPNPISFEELTRAKQHWFCEYYLPSEVHVVKKDFDVLSYAQENGINYEENFWKKDGYIVLNFDIETISNKERHLSYINPDNQKSGYCNMWKTEGYAYKKTDYRGNQFQFQDGDYIMFYTESSDQSQNTSAAQDYRSGGTH